MGRNTPESPGNAKKRRRTNNAAAALPQSSPVPDLVPPPLSCHGDTVFASNPFDDTVTTTAPLHGPGMGHMGPMGMMPGGLVPGMQGSLGSAAGGPIGSGPVGSSAVGPVGPNSMNGPYGPNIGPGPNMGPGMPGGMTMPGMPGGMGGSGMPVGNGMGGHGMPGGSIGGPGMPGGNGVGGPNMGHMVPSSVMSNMAVSSSMANSHNAPLNSLTSNMNRMNSMSTNINDMGLGLGPPGHSGMQHKSMPHPSRKVYPPDQPMVFNPQNPNAPPIYPCGMCHKEVHENDQAILCESGCNFWFHRMCTGLMEQAYQLLIAEVYAEWACDRCLSTKNIPLIKFKP